MDGYVHNVVDSLVHVPNKCAKASWCSEMLFTAEKLIFFFLFDAYIFSFIWLRVPPHDMSITAHNSDQLMPRTV